MQARGQFAGQRGATRLARLGVAVELDATLVEVLDLTETDAKQLVAIAIGDGARSQAQSETVLVADAIVASETVGAEQTRETEVERRGIELRVVGLIGMGG